MFIKEAIEEFCNNTVPSRATVPSQTVKFKPVQICLYYYPPITCIVFMKQVPLGIHDIAYIINDQCLHLFMEHE